MIYLLIQALSLFVADVPADPNVPAILNGSAVIPKLLRGISPQSCFYLKRIFQPNIDTVMIRSLIAVICQHKKFPHKLDALYAFIANMSTCIEMVPIPDIEPIPEGKIRDIDDRTIYRAALAAGCDVIVTGDKDLLEAGINNPYILTAAEFVALFG